MGTEDVTETKRSRRAFVITSVVFVLIAGVIAEIFLPPDPIVMSIATGASVLIAVLLSYTLIYLVGPKIGSFVGYPSDSKVLKSYIDESEVAVTYNRETGGMKLTVDGMQTDSTTLIRKIYLFYIFTALLSGAVIGYAVAGGFSP